MPRFSAALKDNPRVMQFWASYIDALILSGRRQEAKEALGEAKNCGLGKEIADDLESRIDQVRSDGVQEESRLIEAYRDRDYVEVERLARLMTEKHPENGFGWKALGAALKQMKKHEDALLPMQKATELLASDPEAFFNLGLVQRETGRYGDAKKSFGKAIALYPEYAEALSNLGYLMMESGNTEEAELDCRKAVSLKPDYAKGHNIYGTVLHKLGRLDEAEVSFAKAIELKPDYAEAYKNLGVVLNDQGRMDAAAECYRKALLIEPDYSEGHYNLSAWKIYTQQDPHISALREILSENEIRPERIYACFALGKAMEDIGEYDEAFDLYLEGNRLKKQELGYSIEQDKVLFERIRQKFGQPVEIGRIPFGAVKPILVVGMPRSGTSLVEQILASHSGVYGAGELETLNQLVVKHFFDDLSGKIAAEYFENLSALSGGNSHVVDKMPLNFRWLGFLLAANPDIKVVHTKRDAMATCWSIFKLYFPAKGMGFAWDLKDVAEYYKLYRDLMAFWHQKFPGRIYDLDYDRLTENQEEETRKLLEYCGVPWEDACLNFHDTKRAVRTASAAQVRKKMYRGSSEAWKKFEQHLGPLKISLE